MTHAMSFGMTTAAIGIVFCIVFVLLFLYYNNDPFPMPAIPWGLYFMSFLCGPSMTLLGASIMISGKIP